MLFEITGSLSTIARTMLVDHYSVLRCELFTTKRGPSYLSNELNSGVLVSDLGEFS